MNRLLNIALTALLMLIGTGGVGIQSSQGQESVTTTFIGSTIEGIDTNRQMITIRTPRGSTWSLQVMSADLLQSLQQGDRASLELDDQGRVKKIVKIAR
ncbi:MAG TPA: hypothetical protein VJ692_05530 [Nitrospiraceae bacterium]|nr:hypothetical protein [Nitrospiraceae bacterium]